MSFFDRVPRAPALALLAAMVLGGVALAWSVLRPPPAPAQAPQGSTLLGDDGCAPDLDD